MSESGQPRSPFAGLADFSDRPPVRMLSRDEIEHMLAGHRLYLETEYHQGHRANFASVDLAGRDFSGLNLRGIKMDRALLSGADFTGAYLQSANLVGLPLLIPLQGPAAGHDDLRSVSLRIAAIARQSLQPFRRHSPDTLGGSKAPPISPSPWPSSQNISPSTSV